MILDAAKKYKHEKEVKLNTLMIDMFEKMLEKCTEEKERTPFLIENGCILWEGMFFTINNKFDKIHRVIFCSNCDKKKRVDSPLTSRENLIKVINTLESCQCESTLEDCMYKIALKAVNDEKTPKYLM